MAIMREPWDEHAQLRHAAKRIWPRLGRGAEDYLRLCRDLGELGYDGCVASLGAEDIIHGWRRAGWLVLSPDHTQVRVTSAGAEQLAKWAEEDRLWQTGGADPMPLAKRLVAGEPARNLRKIHHEISNATVTSVHDPYTRTDSLKTLLKLADMGASLAPELRILGSNIAKITERISLVGLLRDINSERKTTWEIRVYPPAVKPHRRFLVFDDGGILTCGMSLNSIDKDEVLERIVAGSEYAQHDRRFFEENWHRAQPL